MIWAPILKPELVQDLLRQGIPVTDRLETLPFEPDLIHGHHHLETIAALEFFPRAKALFVVHSGYCWIDHPPCHPRIRRYVAVSEWGRSRLEAAPWIEPHQISTIPNAVDLERFRPRPPLPSTPRRALVFSNYVEDGPFLDTVRAACRRTGLALDVVGSGTGRLSTAPETLLPDYDLVFAKGRCALEAMAVGCAVILCEPIGFYGLIRRRDVELLQVSNFGVRLLDQPVEEETLVEEIRAYSAADAASVALWTRREASLTAAARRYLAVGDQVLADDPAAGLPDDHPHTVRLQVDDQASLRLRLLERPLEIRAGEVFPVTAELENASRQIVATAAPWPTLLMYRWIGPDGATVVEHGMRSIVQPPCHPQTSQNYLMHVIAPDTPGEYRLRLTMIQEGWRWLDRVEPPLQYDTFVSVTPFRATAPTELTMAV